MVDDVRVRVLGPLAVATGTVPDARQQRLVLAALASRAPERLDPGRLIEGIWHGTAPSDARKALQVLIARLRSAIADAGIEIVLNADGYGLEVHGGVVDAALVRRLRAEERDIALDRLLDRRNHLERALALFRGEPFADLPDEPLLADAVAELSLLHADLTSRLHDVWLSLGEGDGLVPELTSWALSHPLDENAWCRLAIALDRTGRRPDALRALHRYRRVIRDTAGLEPSGTLTDLEADLLSVTPVEPHAREPGNLPSPGRSVLGRSADIAALGAQLKSCRLVTLTGPGGIGKTTLAIEAARNARDRYPHGVWLCELAEIESGNDVADLVGDSLGVTRQRGKPRLDSIGTAFSDATALIVLDNCEHVLSAAAEIVRTFQRRCPGLTVLATSRQPLGLSTERVTHVGPLSVSGDSGPGPTGPAIQLFVDRARDSGATFGLGHRSLDAIATICRRLDGLPLAIELAGARCRSMSPTELSRRLDERFRLVGGTAVDRHRRQQTLWNAIDWSYQLLPAADRQRFARLSVFLGGFTVASAAAVTGEDETVTEETLWSLVDRSLLTFEPDGETTRYSMLESLRQFGHQQVLKTGEAERVRDAHLTYFVHFAEDADDHIRGSDEAAAVRSLRTELANLRAAHQHAVTVGHRDRAERLVAALHDYAIWRQFFELGAWARSTLELEVVHRCETDRASAPLPSPHLPLVHATAGWGCCIDGSFDAAVEHAMSGLTAESNGGRPCGWLHDVLSHAAYFRGDISTGLEHGDAEVGRARVHGDPYRLSYVLADHSIHAGLAGHLGPAASQAEEALRLARKTDNPSALAMACLARGFACRRTDTEAAIEFLERADAIALLVESTWISSIARGELAVLMALHGDANEAIELAADQFERFRRAGDDARARGAIRMAIPALYRVLDARRWLDLVALDVATASRPHIEETFIDDAIAESAACIDDHDAVARAMERGMRLDDTALFVMASMVMETAKAGVSGEKPTA